MKTDSEKLNVDITEEAVVSVSSDEADKVIRKNAIISMGIGFVPLPTLGFTAITATSLVMTRNLSKLYGVEFKEGAAKKIIASVLSAAVPALVSGSVSSLLIGLPLIGLPLAIGTKPALNAMCTYAVGRMFVNHFERGGNFINVNLDEMKKDFSNSFKNSREKLGDAISGKKVSVET